MLAYYCQTHDEIIVIEGNLSGVPNHYIHIDSDGWEHELFYMGYWHPDFTRGEVEDIVRERIETFGITYEPTH